MLPILMIIATLGVMRRLRLQCRACSLIATMTLATVTLLGQSPAIASNSNGSVHQAIINDDLTISLYTTAGLGFSELEPDTSGVSGWDQNDRVSSGRQVSIGLDLHKQLSVELHSADIGSAGFSPEGRINYQINGASALLYFGENRHRFLRRGLNAYGRVGYGSLQNSPVGSVPFEQVNGTHVLFGFGMEYMTRSGLGTRAELISFDKDIKYGQLALIYRLGSKAPQKTVQNGHQPVLAAALASPQAAATSPLPQPAIKADFCAHIQGTINQVNFYPDSAKLSGPASLILDQVARSLVKCSNVPIAVAAHTDSIAGTHYNQGLSERRGASVVSYLTTRGVDAKRLNLTAFGETKPAYSNQTNDGRSRNRRVELIAE